MKSILGYTRTSLDTFDERPFCQVDSLVLSSIAYTFFPKEILPEGDWNGIHFADLLKAECFEQMFHGIWNGKSCLELLIALACSPRFRDILICGYTQKYDAICNPCPGSKDPACREIDKDNGSPFYGQYAVPLLYLWHGFLHRMRSVNKYHTLFYLYSYHLFSTISDFIPDSFFHLNNILIHAIIIEK